MLSLTDTLHSLVQSIFERTAQQYASGSCYRGPVRARTRQTKNAVRNTDRGFVPLGFSYAILWLPRITASLPQMMRRSRHARM